MPAPEKPAGRARDALARLAARAPDGTRAWIIGALGVGAAVFLAHWLSARAPVQSWVCLQVVAIWLWEAYLIAACASFGHRLAQRVLPARDWTSLETLAVGFPAGLVSFVLGIYVAGFLHLLRPALAVVLPGLMLAIGAPPIVRRWRAARAAGDAAFRITLGGLPLVATAVGLLLLGVVYLGAMSPDAINYDASWNHLVIAQDYAREGRIVPFPGDWNKDLPHLGSVLNTWSFLVPGFREPALHWMTALHTEFFVFVATLLAVAAAGRWFAERAQPALWTAFALFPGLFAYDSNIGGSADHFLALFAAPLLLLTGKAVSRLDRGTCLLWGGLAGGALLTKAQGIYLVVPFAMALVGRGFQLAVRGRRGGSGAAPPGVIFKTAALTAGVAFLVLLPHLGSNYVFFRNPVYPLLQDVFTASTPTVKDAAQHVTYLLADWRYRAPDALFDKLKEGLKVAFTFSFVPHYSWVNELPVFGSAFTLSLLFLPWLPALRNARRLWLGALLALAAVFAWALTYRVDRNLQAVTPALIAVTAAILVRAWEAGLFARVGVAALVLVQLAWAGNVYFQGADRIGGAANLLRTAVGGRSAEGLGRYRREFIALRDWLPQDAVLMLHDAHNMLGIERPVLLDWIGFQGLFDYRLYQTPRDLYDRLRALGVTHVAWLPVSPVARSKQEELIFDAFVDASGQQARRFGAMSVFALPAAPPPPVAPYRVLVVALGGYGNGLYPVDALSTCEELPPNLQRYAAPSKVAVPPANVWSLLDEANTVFIGSLAPVDGAVADKLNLEFRLIRAYNAFRLFVRR
jgi:hypothetical protein